MRSYRSGIAVIAATLLSSVVVPVAMAQPTKTAMAVTKLGNLEDREAIEAVMVRYMHAFDQYDADAYTNCFTSDGQMSFGGQTFTGTKEIHSILGEGIIQKQQELWLKAPLNTMKGYHLLNNVNIDIVSPDEAHVRSYWHWITGPSGSGPYSLTAIGVYDDVIVRTAQGWKIKKRVVTL